MVEFGNRFSRFHPLHEQARRFSGTMDGAAGGGHLGFLHDGFGILYDGLYTMEWRSSGSTQGYHELKDHRHCAGVGRRQKRYAETASRLNAWYTRFSFAAYFVHIES